MKKVILIVAIIIFLLGGCDYFSSPASWDKEAFEITPTVEPGPGGTIKDCSYEVEPSVTTRINDCVEGGCCANCGPNGTPNFPPDCCSGYLSGLYGFLKDPNRRFVRVKRNAWIQCTKQWHSGSHSDSLGGEMIRIGSTPAGEMVFLARGHCYWGAGTYGRGPGGVPENYCVDPLTIQTIFVLKVRGADKNNCPPDTASLEEKERKSYWWIYDVYVDREAFANPNNPTAAGLPAWIRNCQGWLDGRGETLGASTEGKVLASQTFNYPTVISPYTDITPIPARRDDLRDYYLFDKTVDSLPTAWGQLLGKYKNTQINVWISADGNGTLALGSGQTGDKYYQYMILGEYTIGIGKTLQLASFLPTRPPPRGRAYYEWWTPSCKPALYFYPEKPTKLSVIVKPKGKITQSIPDHKDGWQIVVYPDGTITKLDGTKFPYLYYEAQIEKVKIPQENFLVEGKDLPEFFGQALPLLGLNQKEAANFLEYWLPKLQGGQKWLIGLLPKEEINRVEKIEFSSNPDNFLRVRFYFRPFEGLNETLFSERIIYSEGMNLEYFFDDLGVWSFRQKPQRFGFTVVDWGGILAGGDCGTTEIAQ